MEKYVLPSDVSVMLDSNTLKLNRGVINYQEIDIDVQLSNPSLIEGLKDLSEGKVVEFSDQETLTDMQTLEKMGYVQRVIDDFEWNDLLFIVDDFEYTFYKNNLPNNAHIYPMSQLINESSFQKMLDIADRYTKLKAVNEVAEKFQLRSYKHLLWIDSFYHLNRIRAFNRLMKSLNIETTFCLSDYSLLLLTSIKYGVTGCFECLEQQIKGKIGDLTRLNESQKIKSDYLPTYEIALKFGLVASVADDLIRQERSNTFGNIIEWDTRSKEYFFDSNRIQSTCSVCATQSNAYHEEQNIKTIHLLNALGSGKYEN